MNASRVDVTSTQSAKTHQDHLIAPVVMDTLVMALHAQVIELVASFSFFANVLFESYVLMDNHNQEEESAWLLVGREFCFFTRSRLQSREDECWSMLVVGQPTLSRPMVSASLHRQLHCTKRNRRFTGKGKGETKETKERRTEEVGGFEICGGAEGVKNGLS